MRQPDRQPPLRLWLTAKSRDDDAAAEQALGAVFATLPRPMLPAGFAERVLLRVAGERVAWPLERAALWLLAACAAALSLLPFWLPRLLDRLALEALVGRVAEALVGGARALAALAPYWEAMVRVGHWVGLALSAPPALLFIAFCGLLSTKVAPGSLRASWPVFVCAKANPSCKAALRCATPSGSSIGSPAWPPLPIM
jgi:hypothetical protein